MNNTQTNMNPQTGTMQPPAQGATGQGSMGQSGGIGQGSMGPGSGEPGSKSEEMKAGAREAGARASEKVKQAGASAKQSAREMTGELKARGSEAAHRLQDQSKAFAETRKSELGDKIHGCGSAVRRAAEKLREENDPNIAHYAEVVAERLESAGDYVKAKDFGGMMRDVENAARRRPEILFAGMFVAGLALSRFLKASSKRDDHYADNEDYWVDPDEDYDDSFESPVLAGEAGGTNLPGTADPGAASSPIYPSPKPAGFNS